MPRCSRAGRSSSPGRSMIDNVAMARQLGYLNVPDGVIVGVEEMRNTPAGAARRDHDGQPGRADERAHADGERRPPPHHDREGRHGRALGDAHPRQRDRRSTGTSTTCFRLGADVLYNRVSNIHVRGHASREELKIIQGLLQPEYFVPIHGEYRHLVVHAQPGGIGRRARRERLRPDGRRRARNRRGVGVDGRSASPRVTSTSMASASAMLTSTSCATGPTFRRMASSSSSSPSTSRRARWTRAPEVLSRGFVDVEEREELLDRSRDVVARALAGRCPLRRVRGH